MYYVTAVYSDPDGESEASNIVLATPIIVSIEEENIKPLKTELVGNYPNPFNPETIIKFSLQQKSNLQVDIYNIKGQLVRSLIDREYPAGNHEIIWNGKDYNGNDVSSGIYFYRMQTEEYVSVKRMMMVK